MALALLAGGCDAAAPAQENITFAAFVESVEDDGLLVTVIDDAGSVGFDRAFAAFSEGLEIGFEVLKGSRIEITALPEIRESDPVQVTAVELAALDPASYETLSGQEARQMMDDGGAVVLDVRTPEEYNSGYIPDAILLPVDELGDRYAEVLPEKDAVILVYCRSGNRSARAAQALANLGYTRVYDFGGILDWPYETAIPS